VILGALRPVAQFVHSSPMRLLVDRRRIQAFILLTLTAVGPVLGSGRPGPSIADAYINHRGNVVLVGTNGRETVVTSKGGCERIEVAKDHRSVAWSKSTKRGSAVFIYRDGVVRKIDGDPFVGGFWFVDGGRWIALESGGMHFAGWESLYDVATLKRLAEFNQSTTPATDRPYWSSNTYKDE
jgi:hypothetical protein